MTPLKPCSCAMSSSVAANRVSLSTISTTRSPGTILSRSSWVGGTRLAAGSARGGGGVCCGAGTGSAVVSAPMAAGGALTTAGSTVRLLESLKDDLLLVRGDTDAAVRNHEGNHLCGLVQLRAARRPAALGGHDSQLYGALGGELEGVRQQVLQNLLQALLVGLDHCGQSRIDADREIEVLLQRRRPEGPIDVVPQVRQAQRPEVERYGPRLDLRQVEDVADQRKQVRSRGIDGLRIVDLLRRQVVAAVVREE